jgi:small subunit ribosomal protein S6
VRDYELVVIYRPDLGEEEGPAAFERVTKAVTERGGTLTKSEPWGKRRLAYPIKKFNEGTYFLAQFQLDPKGVRDLNAQLKVSEQVLRHMIVRVES